MQRHHLLPRQLLSRRCFAGLFEALGRERLRFDDFRFNGLLLPASHTAALRTRLSLHRVLHGTYNALVAERVGQIEASWVRWRCQAPDAAADEAWMRLSLLQRALRRRLLVGSRRPLRLNRSDHWAPGSTSANSTPWLIFSGPEPHPAAFQLRVWKRDGPGHRRASLP
jgi:hypothetical protein